MAPVGPGTGIGGEAEGAGRATTGGGPRARPPGEEAANAAVQGTGGGEMGGTGDDAGAAAFEVVDEGGELVRVRFHEFLQL